MNATEAKELLMPIPHDQFIEGVFTNYENKCCAIGHLVRLKSKNPKDYSSDNCNARFSDHGSEALEFGLNVTKEFIFKTHNMYGTLAEVNNTDSVNGYNQDKPKNRVIACLDDMIKAGY